MDERGQEIEIELAASAAAAWDALVKPEEIVRWFTPEARIEPGSGGKLWLRWADGTEGEHAIVEWQPEKRLVLGWNGQSIVFEISGRGGVSTLRLVHSGFSMDSRFDDEFEATFGGWSTYLGVLRYELANKRGEAMTNVTVFRMVEARRADVWPSVEDTGAMLGTPLKTLLTPAQGYVVSTAPALNDSPVALFCEKLGGKTYVTVAAFLFGDARRQAETLRARITGALGRL